MPRESRKSINSKYIHVITQGIKKEYIFKNDKYKQEYIKLLNDMLNEYENTKLLAYCIMDNHAHLLIYTDKIEELSKIMSRVNTSYGIFYNKHRMRVGYVFRNRYYTQEIADIKHLFNTLAYIHKNPVKAGIVKNEIQYKFSSYKNYIQKNVNKEDIKLIFDTEDYLKQFKFIHKNFSSENIIDVKEEQEKSEEKMKKIIIRFCNENNWELDYIKKNNYLLLLLINNIKNNCDVTNKVITEYLKIGKNRISNILKKSIVE